MKKTFALLVFALVAKMCAFADDGEYLVLGLNGAAGSVERVSTQNVSSIVFANGSLQLQKGGTLVKSYDRQTVHKLYFSSETTAIDRPAMTDTEAESVVYSLEGRLLGKKIDVGSLPKGVYVVKKGGKARKIVRP